MMTKRPILLTALVMVILVLGVGIAGAQMEANNEPTTSGDVSVGLKKCVREVAEAPSGQNAVVSKACSFIVDVDPEKDLSDNRDYQVFWFQVNVAPKNGFCLTKIKNRIRVPDGYRIESSAPGFVQSNQRRKYTTRLPVKAGGGPNDDRVGSVKNIFGLFPGVIDPTLEDNKFVVTWEGETEKAAALALGIEVSYPQGDPPARRAHGFVDSTLRTSC